MKTKPMVMLLTMLAGWMNRQQQEIIEYLKAENAILREELQKVTGEMSIGTLLESVVIENAVIWIGPAVWKSQVRAKVRATVAPVALLRRFHGVPAMS